MKTWEMIKELTEDSTKKFETVNYGGMKCVASVQRNTKHSYIQLKDEEEEKELQLSFGAHGKGILSYDWTEVIEPVDFITAYQDCLENDMDVSNYISEEGVVMFKGADGVITLGLDDAKLSTCGYVGLSVKWFKQ